MQKIFVPLEIHACQYNTLFPVHGANSTYIQKLVKYDLLPVFVSALCSKEQIDYLYSTCDGAMYMGGADIDPALYDREKHEKTSVEEADRDLLEIPYLKRILADKKPFLGICRGAQALVIASGGTLLQHVPDQFPHEQHSPGSDAPYDVLATAPKHDIHIDRDSRSYSILGTDTIAVNSYHHQMTENPGEHLTIVARSSGGVVEIIEHTDPQYFCFGVQSHPEVEEPSFFEPFFAAFAEVVKSHTLRHT